MSPFKKVMEEGFEFRSPDPRAYFYEITAPELKIKWGKYKDSTDISYNDEMGGIQSMNNSGAWDQKPLVWLLGRKVLPDTRCSIKLTQSSRLSSRP